MQNIQDTYLQHLNDMIRRYAYEYWDMPAFITVAEIPNFKYNSRDFNTNTINDVLHVDIVDYISKRRDWVDKNFTHLDIMEYKSIDPTSILAEIISKGCTKMMVLPDVFSDGKFSVSQHHPVMNQEQKNLIFFDENIFQLIENSVSMVLLNYNTKMYLFWNPTTDPNNYMIFSKLKVMGVDPVVSLTEGRYTGYYNNDPEKGYSLSLTIDNKVALSTDNPVASFYIPLPYTVIDKASELIDLPMPNPPVHDFNISNNVFVGSYQALRTSGDKYFNGRNLLFTNMGLAINHATREYKILDFSAESYDFVERIDKHTIKIKNYDKYDTIIMFRKPFNYSNYSRIDTIYDEILQVSKSAINEMGKVKFNTNSIFYMIKDEDMSWDEIEEMMYNTDPHIAQLIGETYPMTKTFHISEGEIYAPGDKLKDIEFDGWCLKFTIFNPSKYRPITWLNSRLNTRDVQFVQDLDHMYVILNSDAIFDFIKITIDRRYNDPVEIRKMIGKADMHLTVALFPLYDVLQREFVYGKSYPSLPLNRVINDYLMIAPAEMISQDAMIFNNGYLTTLNGSDTLVKSVDVISPYDYFIENSDSEIDASSNADRRTLSNTVLQSRMSDGYSDGCRLLMNNNFRYRDSVKVDDIDNPVDCTLPIIPGRTLLFGSYGDLILDNIGFERLSLRVFRYRDLKLGVSPEQSIGINVNSVDIPNTNGSDNFIFPIDPKRFTTECLDREWAYNVLQNQKLRALFYQKDIKPLYTDMYTLIDKSTRDEYTAWSTYRVATRDNPYDNTHYMGQIKSYHNKSYILNGDSLKDFPVYDSEIDTPMNRYVNNIWVHSLNTVLYKHRVALRHFERHKSYVLNNDALIAPKIQVLNPNINMFDYWMKTPVETVPTSMAVEFKRYGRDKAEEVSLEEHYAGTTVSINTNMTVEKTLF